jgi:hypothetical protein
MGYSIFASYTVIVSKRPAFFFCTWLAMLTFVEAFTGKLPVLSTGRQHESEWAISDSNSTAPSRDMAQRWYSSCLRNHRSCSARDVEKKSRKRQPSRLLEFTLRPDESDDIIRLVDKRSLPEDVEYVALSHCWGKTQVYKLQKRTEPELRKGIPISSLAKTFRDAIEVCRWLDYKYIWIDSLCIKQDSTEDWRQESHAMEMVYSNAAITIAAAHAKDSTQGLFVSRDSTSIIPPSVVCSWDNNFTSAAYCIVDLRMVMSEIDFSNLALRAWTVQERVLSPRLLSFGKSQMFYQCRESNLCESFPAIDPQSRSPYHLKQLYNQELSPSATWANIVRTYGMAALTYERDKMTALAGVAGAMEDILHDRYVVGLWRKHFAIELLWTMNQADNPRPNPCIAPTWSWLSTNGGVSVSTGAASNYRKVLIDVVSIDTNPINSAFPTGEIHQGALLEIRGRLRPAMWEIKHRYGVTDFRRYQITFENNHTSLNDLDLEFFTHVDESPSLALTFKKPYILPVAIRDRNSKGSSEQVRGLILALVNKDGEIYERIGSFTIAGKKASYLFLQPSPRQLKSEPLDIAKHLVEDFEFLEAPGWSKIPMKDIILV